MPEHLNRALYDCILGRPDVLTDTIECQESRFAGLTSPNSHVNLRHYPDRPFLDFPSIFLYLI
jgi:hypothetical protein